MSKYIFYSSPFSGSHGRLKALAMPYAIMADAAKLLFLIELLSFLYHYALVVVVDTLSCHVILRRVVVQTVYCNRAYARSCV